MKIVIVNRYFHPDTSATSQIASDLAYFLASGGHKVEVVTSRNVYSDPGARLLPFSRNRGVLIHRVLGSAFGRATTAGRLADYLTFYIFSFVQLLFLLRSGDIVIAKTDPPLIAVPVALAAVLKRAKLVNWYQDLYPEVAAASGVPGMTKIVLRFLQALRTWAARRAVANVTISDGMASMLARGGVDRRTVQVIPNWSDDDAIKPVSEIDAAFRSACGLEGRFIVAYSGNLGRAHDYETLLSAADLVRDVNGIAFVFIGGGQGLSSLKQKVSDRGLCSLFHFLPYQAREDLHLSLGMADVHWVSLKSEFEGLIFPSKTYGIAAAGRPILAVCDIQGELARLVRENDCGISVSPGDGEGLAAAIKVLAEDHVLRRRLGINSRKMLERSSSSKSLEAWSNLLRRANNPEPTSSQPSQPELRK